MGEGGVNWEGDGGRGEQEGTDRRGEGWKMGGSGGVGG